MGRKSDFSAGLITGVSLALVVVASFGILSVLSRKQKNMEEMSVKELQELLSQAVDRNDFPAAARYRDMIAKKLNF